MKQSQLFGQTLREPPADSTSPGHAFLARAAYLSPNPWAPGFLPLGQRAFARLCDLVCGELDALGGQEMEIHTSIEQLLQEQVQSYRQLPRLVYHHNGATDDSVRGGGLFGVQRSPTVDAYILAASSQSRQEVEAGLIEAAGRITDLLGLPVITADESVDNPEVYGFEYYFPTPVGGLTVLRCPSCGYADDQRTARFRRPAFEPEAALPLEKVHTPDCKTITALANFLGVPESRTAKAVFLREVFGERLVFVVVRGDMDLSLNKLKRHVMTEPADEDDIRAVGAEPGYGSPIGLPALTGKGAKKRKPLVIVDELVAVAPNLVAGANEPGYHFKHVNYGRDFTAHTVADIAQAKAGDLCLHCGTPLEAVLCAPLANLHFRGGSGDVPTYTDAQGKKTPVHVGFFRIDVGRAFAALAETHHDERGLMLPPLLAPFDVHLIALPGKAVDTRAAAEEIYETLQNAGFSVLYDDRDERAGVKFNDADLIGCPFRITVGEKNLDKGVVEVKRRGDSESRLVALAEVASAIRTA
jgi:prolyl-tRNA synthetase